jgi:hypothetical protein
MSSSGRADSNLLCRGRNHDLLAFSMSARSSAARGIIHRNVSIPCTARGASRVAASAPVDAGAAARFDLRLHVRTLWTNFDGTCP